MLGVVEIYVKEEREVVSFRLIRVICAAAGRLGLIKVPREFSDKMNKKNSETFEKILIGF